MITYAVVAAVASHDGPVGARVRALREAMGLSLRDLAERSGVSAPMLSQVERGETSPTLAVAERIAAGLELTLSQLLRLDEGGHVVVTRARASGASATAAAIAPRSSRRRCRASARTSRCTCSSRAASTGRPGDPPLHEPGAARPRWCSPGRPALMIDDERHDLEPGDSVTFDADLPHHFDNHGDGAGRVPGRRRRRAAKELS